MKTFGRTSWFINLLSLVLALIVWLLFAPTQLGGQMTYVIVDGNSMEPRFHYGDLVMVRKQPAYQVGDAVTYRNGDMGGRLVFHRIVSLELDRFVLQGDNNKWLDSYLPSQDEIIGKQWLHIPSLGKGIEWAREPLHFALTSGLLGGLLMLSMIVPSPRGPGRKNRPAGIPLNLPGMGLYLTGFIALAFLGFGIFAFTRPLTRSAGNIQYQQEGFFFYSATATPGLYDTDKVRPGEPLFPKLTCFLNVAYAYNMTGAQVQGMAGSHQLYARVLDEQSGWQRTIPLQAATAFSGPAFFSLATVDLCQVEAMVSSLEAQTGLRSSILTLEIVSEMAFTGDIAGITISDTFNPSLVFKFDKVHFYLPGSEAQEDALHVSKPGMLGSSEVTTNTLSLAGWKPTVLTVRIIALAGLAASLGGLLILAWPIINRTRQDQEALIRLKYGSLLMNVHERNLEPDTQIIDVASIDDLARLAERQNTMIQHMKLNFLNHYFVHVNGATYRHVLNADKSDLVAAKQSRMEITQITRTQITKTELFGKPLSNDERDLVDIEADQDDIFSLPADTDKNIFGRTDSAETVMLRKIRL